MGVGQKFHCVVGSFSLINHHHRDPHHDHLLSSSIYLSFELALTVNVSLGSWLFTDAMSVANLFLKATSPQLMNLGQLEFLDVLKIQTVVRFLLSILESCWLSEKPLDCLLKNHGIKFLGVWLIFYIHGSFWLSNILLIKYQHGSHVGILWYGVRFFLTNLDSSSASFHTILQLTKYYLF